MIKNYNRFLNENVSNKLEIDVNTHLFDSGYKLFFDIYVGGNEIGKCEVETKFKKDDFNDKIHDYSFSRNMDFNHLNIVKKKDYDNEI